MEGTPAKELKKGWYTDPFCRHEARWLSAGKPTKLVRDYGVESYDEPPDEPPSQEPTPALVYGQIGSVDMRRADDVHLPSNDPYIIEEAAYGGALNSWLRATGKLPTNRLNTAQRSTFGLRSVLRYLRLTTSRPQTVLLNEGARSDSAVGYRNIGRYSWKRIPGWTRTARSLIGRRRTKPKASLRLGLIGLALLLAFFLLVGRGPMWVGVGMDGVGILGIISLLVAVTR